MNHFLRVFKAMKNWNFSHELIINERILKLLFGISVLIVFSVITLNFLQRELNSNYCG